MASASTKQPSFARQLLKRFKDGDPIGAPPTVAGLQAQIRRIDTVERDAIAARVQTLSDARAVALLDAEPEEIDQIERELAEANRDHERLNIARAELARRLELAKLGAEDARRDRIADRARASYTNAITLAGELEDALHTVGARALEYQVQLEVFFQLSEHLNRVAPDRLAAMRYAELPFLPTRHQAPTDAHLPLARPGPYHSVIPGFTREVLSERVHAITGPLLAPLTFDAPPTADDAAGANPSNEQSTEQA